jgi:hypothetical protein
VWSLCCIEDLDEDDDGGNGGGFGVLDDTEFSYVL